MKTFVIAEAGSTWRIGPENRHLKKALKCVQLAQEAGADCVKFQWTSDPRLMEQRRKVPPGTYDILAWPEAWLSTLAAACEHHGVEFLCTVFLAKDVSVIAPFVRRFKVASLEAKDMALYEAYWKYEKPIIASLGALQADEIKILDGLERCKKLQCTAAYPSPLDQLNLSTIAFSVNDGYVTHGLSDHSRNLLTGALAVACGAEIVEVHFKLDETPKDNPDFPHSHIPAQLAIYIANIRKAERMLGDGVKKVEASEIPMLQHRVTA